MLILEAAAFLLLLAIPGLIAIGITGGRGVEYLAALPVTCGLTYVLSNYSSLLGINVNQWWYLGLLGVAMTTAIATRGRLRISNQVSGTRASLEPVVAVGSALVLTLLWHKAVGNPGQLLPNHDAMYHSYVIRNIMETESVRVRDALRLFPVGAGSAASFYPLGVHIPIALINSLLSMSINGSMNLVTVLIGIGLFPITAWVWTRELLGSNKYVSIFAPLAALLTSPVFPWSPISWGGMPAIVAMTSAPIVAVVVSRALQDPSGKRIVSTSLVLIGIFGMHSTELVTVFVLVAILRWQRHESPIWAHARFLAKVGALSAIGLAPVALSTVGGAGERSLDYQPVMDVVTVLGQTISYAFSGYVLIAAMALTFVGLIAQAERRATALPASFGVLTAVIMLAAGLPSNWLVSAFTKPWYGQVLRLNYNMVYLAIPLITAGTMRLVTGRRRTASRIFCVLLVAIGFAHGIRQSTEASQTLLGSWYGTLIPANQDSIAAYKWMSAHMDTSSEYVMTDVDGVDGSTWMYALTGARPLMYGALADSSRDQFRQVKTDLIASVGDLGANKNITDFIRTHKVRFFYFDERTSSIAPNHTTSLAKLRSEKMLREVYTQRNAHVFEFMTSEVRRTPSRTSLQRHPGSKPSLTVLFDQP